MENNKPSDVLNADEFTVALNLTELSPEERKQVFDFAKELTAE